MARKSMTQLQADILANFPDNTSGLITPALLRTFLSNFVETMTPGYVVSAMVPKVVPLSAGVPVALEGWSAPIVITPEFTFNETTGLTTLNDDFILNFQLDVDFEFSQNEVVILKSNFSGSGTPGAFDKRIDGKGTGDPATETMPGKFDGVSGDTMTFTIECDSSVSVDIKKALLIFDLGPLINTPV